MPDPSGDGSGRGLSRLADRSGRCFRVFGQCVVGGQACEEPAGSSMLHRVKMKAFDSVACGSLRRSPSQAREMAARGLAARSTLCGDDRKGRFQADVSRDAVVGRRWVRCAAPARAGRDPARAPRHDGRDRRRCRRAGTGADRWLRRTARSRCGPMRFTVARNPSGPNPRSTSGAPIRAASRLHCRQLAGGAERLMNTMTSGPRGRLERPRATPAGMSLGRERGRGPWGRFCPPSPARAGSPSGTRRPVPAAGFLHHFAQDLLDRVARHVPGFFLGPARAAPRRARSERAGEQPAKQSYESG